MVAPTRRALLGAGALGLLAAGCGDRTPKPPAGGDAAVLGQLLGVERELVRAWSAAPAGTLSAAALARGRAHARELLGAGARAGIAAPAAVREATARATASGDRADLLDAQIAAGDAYLTGMTSLGGPAARALAVQLYAAGAGQATALRLALGRPPLPDAFGGTLA